jgi:ribosomal protein S18 acetylase RimI-like enzyme
MGAADAEGIAIERGGAEDIESLRGLWLELHHHHQRVGPQSGEFSDDETSWRTRSSNYREWLGDPRSFLLMARAAEELVGYAMVRVMDAGHDRDAWQMPDDVAELETLVISEGARGLGLGTKLMDAVDAELDRLGIEQVFVGLIPGNDGAQSLYERRGFRQRWLVLHRSAGP